MQYGYSFLSFANVFNALLQMLTSATQTLVRTTDSASTAWASISVTVRTPSPEETAKDVSNIHSLSNAPVVRFPPQLNYRLTESLKIVFIVVAM